MFRKIFSILILGLLISGIYAIEVTQYTENQTDTTAGDIAKMKGEITAKIEKENVLTREKIHSELSDYDKGIKEYIDQKTNPFIINGPVIIVLLILSLTWAILKSRGKI